MLTVQAFLTHPRKGSHRLESTQSSHLNQVSTKDSHCCNSGMNMTEGHQPLYKTGLGPDLWREL